MVRGRRLIASQKGHPVHSDIRGDKQKGVIGKDEQVFEMFGLRIQKARKACAVRALRTSIRVLVTINQENILPETSFL